MPNCQNWKFERLKVGKVESDFNIAKLPSCQVISILPSCQIAKLQVAKLWTCDHGAKSLSFLLLEFFTNKKNPFKISKDKQK